VEWQLRVASGEPLPKRQDELSIDGWAMEARLYAENPATGFLPSTGPLEHLHLPEYARIETGVEQGGAVSPFYDPMIAKIVVHEADRFQAIEELWEATTDVEVWPVRTNAGFLARICLDEDFRSGNVDTGLIERRGEVLTLPQAPEEQHLREAAAALSSRPVTGVWEGALGLRINGASRSEVRIVDDTGTVYLVDDAVPDEGEQQEEVVGFFLGEGRSYRLYQPRGNGGAGTASDGAILAPMPGRVTAVDVAAGATVAKGQRLITLEAMKMEHGLTAPFDGVVAELNAEPGAQVSEGIVLVKVERASETA
jgi:3-methylcrotonyl-CoA carboxylase alpha subunit